MSAQTKMILELVSVIVPMVRDGASENQILTKLVRFAERQVVGSKVGGERLKLVLAILRMVRPAMVSTAEKLQLVERKIRHVVVALKDLDDDDEGLDDFVAEKLEVLADAVDHVGDFFTDAANWLQEKFDAEAGTEEIFVHRES